MAFSARGIAKCLDGKDRDKAKGAMATFPPAFRLGMAGSRESSRRWRRLGAGTDGSGRTSSAAARIGRKDTAIDAVLFIYGGQATPCLSELAKSTSFALGLTELGLKAKSTR